MKYTILLLVPGLFLAALAVACAPPGETKQDVASVRAAIEEANDRFEAAFNRGDADAVTALYTDDAIVLPPNQPMVEGAEAILKQNAEDLGAGVLSDLELSVSQVEVYGDVAVEVGHYSIQVGGTADQGKYVVVWKKEAAGGWKLHRDIWNSDLPLADTEQPSTESSDR